MCWRTIQNTCVALLSLYVTGCYPAASVEGLVEPVRVVETLPVQRQAITATDTFIGRIEPWREATLYFEVSGIVQEIRVEEGHAVEAGQTIARLELSDYELGLNKAMSEHKSAVAQLDLLESGTRAEDLEAAKAELGRAQARARFWKSELARSTKLYQQNKTVSESDFLNTQQEHDAALQTERLARSQYEKAVAGPRAEEIQAARAAVEASQQAVALARRQLDKATLVAPFAGRVERRHVDPGAYNNTFPSGGIPVVHLVDLSSVDAVLSVPEEARRLFQQGQSVAVQSAMQEHVHAVGQVISVGDVADHSAGTYLIRIRLENTKHIFTGGMVVVASAPEDKLDLTAIQVPVHAVRSAYGESPYVLVAESSNDVVHAVHRDVTIGTIHDDWITITSGLAEGEQLIVRGQHWIVAGDIVSARPATNYAVAHKDESSP